MNVQNLYPNFLLLPLLLSAALPLCLNACGSSTSSSDIKYVSIGASDATGVGASPLTNGYVYRIEDALDEQCADSELINVGIPGVDADTIEDVEVPAAIALDPELITVWTGSNDLIGGRSVESFESDLMEILTKLRSDTDAQIFVANLPNLPELPKYESSPDADVTTERVDAFNAAISRQTAAIEATLVDLNAIELTDVLVSDDGFHPSDTGHQGIATLFLQEILPQLELCN